MKKRNIVILLIVLVAIDQITKQLVTRNMELFQTIDIIDGFFRIFYIRNTGAAFSILEGQRAVLIIMTIVSFALTAFLYKDAKTRTSYVATTMFLAGTLGNFIDRIIYHSVIDFFSFTFGAHSFAIFNVADMMIVCGVITLIIEQIILVFKKEKPSGNIQNRR